MGNMEKIPADIRERMRAGAGMLANAQTQGRTNRVTQ
jgi:hypothetical protein